MKSDIMRLMKTNKKLTGTGLKLIAIITMTIDHIGASLLEMYPHSSEMSISAYRNMMFIDAILRGIGRIAFPLFIFLLIEGLNHTHNAKKYIVRLFCFALISEVPFDLAFNNEIFYSGKNNVFFTLAIGLTVCLIIKMCSQRITVNPSTYDRILVGIIDISAIVAGALLANLLYSDYGASGVMAIVLMYLLSQQNVYTAYVVMVCYLGLTTDFSEFYAIIGLVFIYMYNGQRGKQNKYLFYIYYPAHLLILFMIRRYILM